MPASKLRFHYEYPRPAVTADAILWTFGERGWRVLLIQRKSEPFAGRWAIPGGFVNPDEPPRDAAIRELHEETNVLASDFHEVGVFGEKDRDPRGWTISNAFYALLSEGAVRARAGDDASRTRWHTMDDLPALAFDHDRIIDLAKKRLTIDLYTTRVVRPLLATSFTSAQFGAVARALDGNAPASAVALRRLAAFGLVRRGQTRKWRFVGDPKR